MRILDIDAYMDWYDDVTFEAQSIVPYKLLGSSTNYVYNKTSTIDPLGPIFLEVQ